MNYGELKIYIRDYVQRSDLTNDLFDTWCTPVSQRLYRDMKLLYLDRYETISNPSGDVVYPIDTDNFLFLRDIMSVTIDGSTTSDGQPVILKAVSWEQYNEAVAIGVANGVTTPWCYTMFSTGFKVAPGDQSDFVFNIAFRASDNNFADDTYSNQFLTFAQALYIDAMLIEVYKYLRDPEGEAMTTARYETEVAKYLQFYEWQKTGGNPDAVTGAWSWV